MKKALKSMLITSVFTVGLLSIQPVEASFYSNQQRFQRAEQPQCNIISKGSAMRAAAAYGGKAMSASLSRGNPPMYRVKLLMENGRVRMVAVNACNGQVYG